MIRHVLLLLCKQDEATCEATTDEDGQACEWCALSDGQVNLCLTAEQAGIAEQIGADCGASTEETVEEDPYDTSCLAASLQQDEATCEATTDEDGQACEWCALNDGQTNLCLTAEQAAIAEQIGADCGPNTGEVVKEDPYDTSCLAASLQQDEATCEATTDEDGQACEWCILNDGQVNLCLTAEQAGIAEQIGADCDPSTEETVKEDPYDTSCLAASLQQDEATCEATTDEDGQACEWCVLNDAQVNLCLTAEQAGIAEQIGADCSPSIDGDNVDNEKDPSDPACLSASLVDESTCEASMDEDGRPCEWCALHGGQVHLCLNYDQADIASQIGADCGSNDHGAAQDPL